MKESYTPGLVRFVLTHYFHIINGDSIIEEMAEFTHSNGKGNPNETALTWLADINRAVSFLCKSYDKDLWPEIYQLSPEMMRERIKEMPPAQRYVIKNCIFGDCGAECQRSRRESQRYNCREAWTIHRMADFLNGDKVSIRESVSGTTKQRKKWNRIRNLKQYEGIK